MLIGVIGDTPGVSVDDVASVFTDVDYILHCGNIGDSHVLTELSAFAPVTGVIGRTDSPEVYPFERTLFKKWLDVGVLVAHRIGNPMNIPKATEKLIKKLDPQVVLFGANGESFNSRIENRLFFSPGSAGVRRGKQPLTVGLLEIAGHSSRAEVVCLAERAEAGNSGE